MITTSILPIPLADGIYCGTWMDYHITISAQSEVIQFKVEKALCNMKLPCLVFIKDKKAIVDSGNPVKTQLFNLSQVRIDGKQFDHRGSISCNSKSHAK